MTPKQPPPTEWTAELELARVRDNDRVLRRWLALTSVPLALCAIVPIPKGDDELLFAWDFAERFDDYAPLVLPAIAAFLAIVAAIPRIPPRVRALLAAIGATAIGGIFFSFVRAPAVWHDVPRELQRADTGALLGFVAAPFVAMTFELVMQLDKRSRARAIVAALAWGNVAFRFFVPLRADGDVTATMPFLEMTEWIADLDRDPENILFAAPLLALLLASLLGLLLAFIRAVSAKAKMPTRRFRTSCMAYTLGLLPTVLIVGALGIFAAIEEPRVLPAAFVVGAYIAATLLLLPIGSAHGWSALLDASRDLLRDARGRGHADARTQRAARAILAAIVVALVGLVGWRTYRFFGPDPRDAETRAHLDELATAMVDATMAEPFDEQFLGGYSEFDLRASRGALAALVSEGAGNADIARADVTIEATTLTLFAGDREARVTARLVAIGDRPLRFTELATTTPGYQTMGTLERGSPILADEARRLLDGATSARCLPTLSASDTASFPAPARALIGDPSEVAQRCTEIRRVRSSDFEVATVGGTAALTVIVRVRQHWFALQSSLHTAEAREWIGRVEIVPL